MFQRRDYVLLDPKNKPFVTFKFLYRSVASLKELSILPSLSICPNLSKTSVFSAIETLDDLFDDNTPSAGNHPMAREEDEGLRNFDPAAIQATKQGQLVAQDNERGHASSSVMTGFPPRSDSLQAFSIMGSSPPYRPQPNSVMGMANLFIHNLAHSQSEVSLPEYSILSASVIEYKDNEHDDSMDEHIIVGMASVVPLNPPRQRPRAQTLTQRDEGGSGSQTEFPADSMDEDPSLFYDPVLHATPKKRSISDNEPVNEPRTPRGARPGDNDPSLDFDPVLHATPSRQEIFEEDFESDGVVSDRLPYLHPLHATPVRRPTLQYPASMSPEHESPNLPSIYPQSRQRQTSLEGSSPPSMSRRLSFASSVVDADYALPGARRIARDSGSSRQPVNPYLGSQQLNPNTGLMTPMAATTTCNRYNSYGSLFTPVLATSHSAISPSPFDPENRGQSSPIRPQSESVRVPSRSASMTSLVVPRPRKIPDHAVSPSSTISAELGNDGQVARTIPIYESSPVEESAPTHEYQRGARSISTPVNRADNMSSPPVDQRVPTHRGMLIGQDICKRPSASFVANAGNASPTSISSVGESVLRGYYVGRPHIASQMRDDKCRRDVGDRSVSAPADNGTFSKRRGRDAAHLAIMTASGRGGLLSGISVSRGYAPSPGAVHEQLYNTGSTETATDALCQLSANSDNSAPQRKKVTFQTPRRNTSADIGGAEDLEAFSPHNNENSRNDDKDGLMRRRPCKSVFHKPHVLDLFGHAQDEGRRSASESTVINHGAANRQSVLFGNDPNSLALDNTYPVLTASSPPATQAAGTASSPPASVEQDGSVAQLSADVASQLDLARGIVIPLPLSPAPPPPAVEPSTPDFEELMRGRAELLARADDPNRRRAASAPIRIISRTTTETGFTPGPGNTVTDPSDPGLRSPILPELQEQLSEAMGPRRHFSLEARTNHVFAGNVNSADVVAARFALDNNATVEAVGTPTQEGFDTTYVVSPRLGQPLETIDEVPSAVEDSDAEYTVVTHPWVSVRRGPGRSPSGRQPMLSAEDLNPSPTRQAPVLSPLSGLTARRASVGLGPFTPRGSARPRNAFTLGPTPNLAHPQTASPQISPVHVPSPISPVTLSVGSAGLVTARSSPRRFGDHLDERQLNMR